MLNDMNDKGLLKSHNVKAKNYPGENYPGATSKNILDKIITY